jgi:hypothetical protein
MLGAVVLVGSGTLVDVGVAVFVGVAVGVAVLVAWTPASSEPIPTKREMSPQPSVTTYDTK